MFKSSLVRAMASERLSRPAHTLTGLVVRLLAKRAECRCYDLGNSKNKAGITMGRQVDSPIKLREAAGHQWFANGLDPQAYLQNLPLPGYYGGNRLRGRAGDLVVYQIKSEIGAEDDVRHTLRSLGLKGVFSGSLRISDETNWGYIRKVQDYISVLVMNNVYYKKTALTDDETLQYERIKFGTQTQPGELYRSQTGEYLVVESDRRKLLVAWSSVKSFSAAYKSFSASFQPELSSRRTSIVGFASEDIVVSDGSVEVIEGETREVVSEMKEAGIAAVAFARLGYDDVQFTWRRPYARFSDRDTKFGEVGVLGTNLDLTKAKSFALATGPESILTEVPVEVTVRRQDGRQRTAPF